MHSPAPSASIVSVACETEPPRLSSIAPAALLVTGPDAKPRIVMPAFLVESYEGATPAAPGLDRPGITS